MVSKQIPLVCVGPFEKLPQPGEETLKRSKDRKQDPFWRTVSPGEEACYLHRASGDALFSQGGRGNTGDLPQGGL